MSLSKHMSVGSIWNWIVDGSSWIRQVEALERENARMKSELDKHKVSSLTKLSEKIDHVLDSQDKPMSASELEGWYTQAVEMEEELEQTKKEFKEQVRYLNGQIRDLQADVHKHEEPEIAELRSKVAELDRDIRWFVCATTALRSVTKKVKGDPNQLDDLSPEVRQVVLSALSYVHTYETEYLPEHVEEQDQDGFIFPKDPLSALR